MQLPALRIDDFSLTLGNRRILDPRAKLVVGFGFVLAVTSFSNSAVTALGPLCVYPAILLGCSSVPLQWLLRRLLVAAPLLVLTALALLLSHGAKLATIMLIFSLVLKTTLVVAAALLLTAGTGIPAISHGLRQLGLPAVLTTLLLLTVRYLSVLSEEAVRMLRSRELRSGCRSAVGLRDGAQLIGMLFIRAVARSARVYQAMAVRGFAGELPQWRRTVFELREWLYCIGWLAYFALARSVNLTAYLEGVLVGGGR